MSSQGAEQIKFKFLPDLAVIVQQHQGQLTTDAGLLPIAQFDRQLNYTARIACLDEPSSADLKKLQRGQFIIGLRPNLLRR